MKNKFNALSSKEWLPFQKSWFRYKNREELYRENIRFFTKAGIHEETIYYYGPEGYLFNKICMQLELKATIAEERIDRLQYVVIDLLDEINQATTLDSYNKTKDKLKDLLIKIFDGLEHRRFVSIFVSNVQKEETYFPFAWDLAKNAGQIFSLKDEKIACVVEPSVSETKTPYFTSSGTFFYSMHFRKDEKSAGKPLLAEFKFFRNNVQLSTNGRLFNNIPSWFILKPQPRKKNEILHPAKYPEDLVEMFICNFTKENANIFDPMSGTGSTQLGALKLKRNGYGTELSEFFSGIANQRCKEYLESAQMPLLAEDRAAQFKILNKDARLINKEDFPQIDYVITSPPYWDMLNMKGAENQAKRIEKGLQTNYSNDPQDLGNLENYNDFLNSLMKIYFNVAAIMKPGSYMTIVVKNIKKKGSNYPFAWDLANLLQKKFILLPEVFWCQDDISIAPYGYGNTWVSNTFHQYCLNFQLPL
jgi:DNA modification methylase